MSSVEIRRVGHDEVADMAFPIQAYAFGTTPVDPDELRRDWQWQAELTDNDRLCTFEDGRPTAIVVGRTMRQNIRGEVVPMLGVNAVAAHPAHRRKGHVRLLLDRLHADKRAEGFVSSALWPFRPTFYERFGYVGFPKQRQIRLHPAGLEAIRRLELPGEVGFAKLSESLDEYVHYLETWISSRHGLSLFDEERIRALAARNDRWVVYARVDGTTVGMLAYRTGDFGQELDGDRFLATTPVGRMLLLRWLAGHVDQFSAFTFALPPDERPDLWYTDVRYDDTTVVATPAQSAPMARILSVEGLAGLAAGPARVTVEVIDDPVVKGTWTLDGTSGRLEVSAGGPDPTPLTSHGLSAFVYGVLGPDDVNLRGFGRVSPEAGRALTTLFPDAPAPYLFSGF